MKTWKTISGYEIDKLINNTLKEIFEKENIEELTKYQKRKMIYDYLVNNKEYDVQYYLNLLNYKMNKNIKFERDQGQELLNPLVTNKGICNGFSQVYKILLEKVGIFSYCINCTIKYEDYFLQHQLNIVYNEETNTFSFDDITLGITGQEKNKYFDYENPQDLDEMQGVKPIYDDINWIMLPEEIVYYYLKRDKTNLEPLEITNYKYHDIKDLINDGINIKSVKSEIEKMKTI